MLSLVNVHPTTPQILLSFVNFQFQHAATQNPGHDTKFVTLPFSVLLYWIGPYIFEDTLMKQFDVVSTSLIVWSQVRQFFLMRIVFCTINHGEIT